MTSYTEYDLERDLRAARRARARARGHGSGDRGVMNWIRSRTTDQWAMFAIGFVVGAILF